MLKKSTISLQKSAIYLIKNWRWLLRFYVAWWLLSLILPTPQRVLLGPPQQVEAVKPHVCVHTRLIDEVDEWKIQQSLKLVREMGADTIVELFPWPYAQPSADTFDWASFDRIARHAENQGIHVMARLGLVPEWARSDVDSDFSTLNYLPDESFDEFGAFVEAFAGRYAGVIDHIIIWNEPNISFEWGYRQVDAAGYTRLLQAVYARAHAANPNVVIVAGALAPTLEPAGSPNGLSDVLYLEELYRAGAAEYFDALAIHTYGFTQAPQAEPALDRLNFRRAELLRDVMERYDTPEKPVYITETGWNDHPRWALAVRPSQRIGYTLDAFRWAEENWPWVKKMCVWALRYPAPVNSYPDNFTLITTDFQAKPIYYAIQAYARGLERSDNLWLPAPIE
ncbi:MAG: hypothetical protein D6737_14890 [Chloroflexi bacterium]|nr:MAG: hypothetical protein D6737_14890 [Chloroflexota bacterium]